MTCSVPSLTLFIVNGIFFNYTFIFKISKRLTLPAAKETCRIPPNSYFYFCNWISRKNIKRVKMVKADWKNATPLTWSKTSPVSFTYQHSALPNFLHFLGTPCYLFDLKRVLRKLRWKANTKVWKHISKKPTWSADDLLIRELLLNASKFYLAGVANGWPLTQGPFLKTSAEYEISGTGSALPLSESLRLQWGGLRPFCVLKTERVGPQVKLLMRHISKCN